MLLSASCLCQILQFDEFLINATKAMHEFCVVLIQTQAAYSEIPRRRHEDNNSIRYLMHDSRAIQSGEAEEQHVRELVFV